MTAALPSSHKRSSNMGIFCCLRPCRHRQLPRGGATPPHVSMYHDGPSDKQHHTPTCSSPNPGPQPQRITRRPTPAASQASHLTSSSSSTSGARAVSSQAPAPPCPTRLRPPLPPSLLQQSQPSAPASQPPPSLPLPAYSRTPRTPMRRPPQRPTPSFSTLHTAPPVYTPLSTTADFLLPSYSDLFVPRVEGAAIPLEGAIVPQTAIPRNTAPIPLEAPPSFEAPEIQEHEDAHGTDPFNWPGCGYCRVYRGQ